MTPIVPPEEQAKRPMVEPKSGDGGNRTHATFPPTIELRMDPDEARAVWHALGMAVDLMDQVDDIPTNAPLYGQRDRLATVARRLDHEINCEPRSTLPRLSGGAWACQTCQLLCTRHEAVEHTASSGHAFAWIPDPPSAA